MAQIVPSTYEIKIGIYNRFVIFQRKIKFFLRKQTNNRKNDLGDIT